MLRKLALARLLRADAETLETDAAEIACLLGGDDAFCLAMARNLRSKAAGRRNLARELDTTAAPVFKRSERRAGYTRVDLVCGLTGALACLSLWLATGHGMVSPALISQLCGLLYR